MTNEPEVYRRTSSDEEKTDKRRAGRWRRSFFAILNARGDS
jgi:hypothetical protein